MNIKSTNMFTQTSITATNEFTWTNRTSTDIFNRTDVFITYRFTCTNKASTNGFTWRNITITNDFTWTNRTSSCNFNNGLLKETELRAGTILGKVEESSKFKLKFVEHTAFLERFGIFEPVIAKSIAFKIDFTSSRLPSLTKCS